MFIPSSKLKFIAVLALVASAASSPAAILVSGTLNSFAQYIPYNLSNNGTDNAADWVFWGSIGDYESAPTSGMTYASPGPSSFSNLSGFGSGYGLQRASGGGHIKLNYSNAAGSYTGSATGNLGNTDANPVYAQGTVANISFTHSLLAGEETVNIILFSSAAAVDFTASLSSGGTPFSFTNIFLPTNVSGFYTGLVTLNISGATAGDVLTLSSVANYTDVPSPQPYYGVGFGGANVFATVPEPSTLALVFGAGALAIIRRHRKSIA